MRGWTCLPPFIHPRPHDAAAAAAAAARPAVVRARTNEMKDAWAEGEGIATMFYTAIDQILIELILFNASNPTGLPASVARLASRPRQQQKHDAWAVDRLQRQQQRGGAVIRQPHPNRAANRCKGRKQQSAFG